MKSQKTVKHLPGVTRTTTVVEGNGAKKIIEHDHLNPRVPIDDFLAPVRMLERDAKSGAASRNAGSVRKISPEILAAVIEKRRAHPGWTAEAVFLSFPLYEPNMDCGLPFDNGKRSGIIYLETNTYSPKRNPEAEGMGHKGLGTESVPLLTKKSRLTQEYYGERKPRRLGFERFKKYFTEAGAVLGIKKNKSNK